MACRLSPNHCRSHTIKRIFAIRATQRLVTVRDLFVLLSPLSSREMRSSSAIGLVLVSAILVFSKSYRSYSITQRNYKHRDASHPSKKQSLYGATKTTKPSQPSQRDISSAQFRAMLHTMNTRQHQRCRHIHVCSPEPHRKLLFRSLKLVCHRTLYNCTSLAIAGKLYEKSSFDLLTVSAHGCALSARGGQ